MCWSATADLAAGGVIVAVGGGGVAGVGRRGDLLRATRPRGLGAHRMVGWVVWRGEDGAVSASGASAARVVWAVIALPLLPRLVPVAVLLASSAAGVVVRRQLLLLVGV